MILEVITMILLLVTMIFIVISVTNKEDDTKMGLGILTIISSVMTWILVGSLMYNISEENTYKKALKYNPYEMEILYKKDLVDSLILVDTVYVLKIEN